MVKGWGHVRKDDRDNDRQGDTRAIPTGYRAPHIFLYNNPRTPPVPPWHGKEDRPVSSS